MADGGIQPLVDEIAAVLGKGVSLDDLTGHLVAYSIQQGRADEARIQALLTREVPADVKNWQNQHGVATAVAPVEVPPNPNLGMLARICVPLLHRGVRTGLLWILQSDQTWSAATIVADLGGLQDRIQMLALVQYEMASPHLNEQHQRNQTFYQACQNEAPALAALEHTPVGRVSGAGRLLVSIPAHPAKAGQLTEIQTTQLRVATQQALAAHHQVVASSVQDSHTVALLRAAPTGGTGDRDLHKALTAAVQAGGSWAVFTGASTPAPGVHQLAHAYRQAVAAAQVAAIEPGDGAFTHWDTLGAYQFLATQTVTDARPESVLYERIQAADPTGQLTDTLATFYDHGNSISLLAKQLHLHRTTLYYRLSRLKDVTGTDPLTGAARLELHLAIKADRWNRRPRI